MSPFYALADDYFRHKEPWAGPFEEIPAEVERLWPDSNCRWAKHIGEFVVNGCCYSERQVRSAIAKKRDRVPV